MASITPNMQSKMSLPLPNPVFILEAQSLSTKKARGTPRDQIPPSPPIKSVSSVSRIRRNAKQTQQHALQVSTRKSENSMMQSKHYDTSVRESYFDQCFEDHTLLGTGSFGEVFKARNKDDGKFYAVKRSKNKYKCESDRIRRFKEVDRLEELPRHSNCVQFFKAWEEYGHLWMQMELCETNLSYYCEENHDIPETLIWNYLVDLLLAIKHLHSHDLVHMDIKPANIFISKFNVCKLGDFGLAVDLRKGNLSDASEGDSKYLAAEVMQGIYTKAADIFSLGITILEIACDLDLPTGNMAWQDLRCGRLPFDLMQNMSSELKVIIQLMTLPDYSKRPTAEDLLSLPYVKKVWEKRKKVYTISKMLVTLQNFIQSCSYSIFKLCSFIFFPLKKLCSKRYKFTTPKHSPKVITYRPVEFDFSYSDDECFENSKSTSLSTPSSSERNKLVNSTPISRRKTTTRHYNCITPIPFRCEDVSPVASSPHLNLSEMAPKILFSETDHSDYNEED